MTLSIRSIGQRLILHVIDVEAGGDEDLSAYATLEMIFTKPDKTEVVKSAAILNWPGTDGRLFVDLQEGFLSFGRWSVCARLTVDASHVYYTDSVAFAPGA